ncbi:MAG TPA: glycosyltransferase family 87 protein [Terriglobales bacterium]
MCLLSMLGYVSRVLVQRQKHEAAAYGIPRGNLSDLYPVWLGSRELLLKHKNPYGPEVTRAIQAGYYGRALDPFEKRDPANQQAFAYPVYVAFLLAPTVNLPFAEVQALFRWLLAALTVASVFLWLRFLRCEADWSTLAILVFLTLGTFAAVQGIWLQQLSLLVAALMALSLVLLSMKQAALSGAMLALAMIKPQLAVPTVMWLLLWTAGDLRKRARFAASFLICQAVLVVGGEYILLGWISAFRGALGAYLQYAAGGSLLQQMLNRNLGSAAAACLILLTAFVCWRGRTLSAQHSQFAGITCLVLAVGILIIPMFPPHYQLLLLPSALLLLREWRKLWIRSVASRALLLFTIALLFWQWAAAGALVAASAAGLSTEALWELPLWTSVLLPLPFTACLALLTARPQTERLPRAASP